MLLTPSSHSTCRVQEARWLHKRIRPACFEKGVLATFTSWLQTVDGKEHSPYQANQIGVDISKYLYFCDQEVVRTQFTWDHVSFNKYIAALQKAEISTAGILVKILRLRNFLDYILSTLQPTAKE